MKIASKPGFYYADFIVPSDVGASLGTIPEYIKIGTPQIVSKESTIFFDCDDTLVMWGTKAKKGQKLVAVTNPHDGKQDYLAAHLGHIKVLKDRKARGSFIVVWSAGGFAWAKNVVKALELEQYVDLIMTKPHMYVDDKKAEEFMGEHLYIPYGDGYGKR